MPRTSSSVGTPASVASAARVCRASARAGRCSRRAATDRRTSASAWPDCVLRLGQHGVEALGLGGADDGACRLEQHLHDGQVVSHAVVDVAREPVALLDGGQLLGLGGVPAQPLVRLGELGPRLPLPHEQLGHDERERRDREGAEPLAEHVRPVHAEVRERDDGGHDDRGRQRQEQDGLRDEDHEEQDGADRGAREREQRRSRAAAARRRTPPPTRPSDPGRSGTRRSRARSRRGRPAASAAAASKLADPSGSVMYATTVSMASAHCTVPLWRTWGSGSTMRWRSAGQVRARSWSCRLRSDAQRISVTFVSRAPRIHRMTRSRRQL